MEKIKIEKREKLDQRSYEAYAGLQRNIQFCGDDVKVIAVTSCMAKEGKTSVCMHLCEALASDGKNVLFVDADLRASAVRGRYGIGKVKVGLTEYLIGRAEAEQIIYDTDIDGLHMTFAGEFPPNPNELLGQERFQTWIANVREQYDYVIVDTPAADMVEDAVVASKAVDGVMLVITDSKVSAKVAQSLKKKLEEEKVRILGAVLNKVPVKKKRK